MAYDGQLRFETALDASGLQKGANKLGDIVKGLGLFTVIQKGMGMVISSIDSAVSRVDTLNRFPRVMEQMGYGADNAREAMDRLSNGINGLPTTLDGIVGSAQRLSIATGSLDKGADTALALNNALLASGASSEAASRGAEQYIQALSRNKMEMQEWKILQETMPYALQKTAEAFGYVGTSAVPQLYDALTSGEITMAQFNDKLIQLNASVGGFAEVAQTASGGIATSWANVQTAVVRGTANVIQAVDDGLSKFGGVAGVMDSVKSAVNATFTVIAGASNLLMQNLDGVALAAAGVGVAFGAYKAIQAWNTAAAAARTVSEQLKITQQQLTISVSKNSESRLALAASTAKQAAAEAVSTATAERAKAAKLQLVATEARAAAVKAEEAAATTKGTFAQVARAEADQAAFVAKNAEANATAAATAADAAEARATRLSTAAQNEQNASVGLGTALIGYLTGSITLHQLTSAAAAVTTTLFAVALRALPLIGVAAAVGALVVGIIALIKWLAAGSKEYQKQKEEVDNLSDSQEKLTASTEESSDAYKTNTAEITAQNKVQRDLVKYLRNVQDSTLGTAEKHRKMADTVAQLSSSVDGLNIAYDEETGAIRNINTGQEISLDQLEQLVNAKAELARANAWTERYNQLIQEQTKIQEDLAVIEAKKQEIMANSNLNAREQETLIKELDDAAAGHAVTMEDVEMRLAVVNENIATTNTAAADAVVSSYERMQNAATETGETIWQIAEQWNTTAEAIDAAMQEQNISLDEWVTQQQTAWEDYEESVKERTEGVINSFKKIPGEYDKSAAEMLEILQNNKLRYAEWESAMEEITRQLGPTAAEEFAKLGPEATSAMQEILNSADLLDQYREAFGVKLDEVTGNAVEDWNDPNFIGAPSSAIDTSAQLVTQNTALAGAVTEQMEGAKAAAEAVDFSEVGQNIAADIVGGLNSADVNGAMQGITTAIQNNTGKVTSAITSMSTGVQTALRNMKTQAVSIATQTMTEINSAIVSRSNTVKASATSMGNGVITTLNTMRTQAANVALQMMTDINSAIVSRTGTIRASATAAANSVVSGMQAMVSGGENVANNMMDGIGAAMDRKAPSLYAKAREIANRIASIMAEALDVHSPSRVMIRLFENVMLGIYEGMDGMSGMLYREAERIADGIADRLTLSPDVANTLVEQMRTITDHTPLGGITLVPQAAYAGAGGAAQYVTSLTQNITTPKPLSASEMTREGQDLLRRARWQLP